MEIIGRMHAAGTPVENLARQVGFESERTASFVDAERCEREAMAALCAHFCLPPTEDCPRKAESG